MKVVRKSSRPSAVSRLAIAAILAIGTNASTHGANLYWDSNGTTAGAGTTAAGDWGTSGFWTTDPLGLSSTGAYTAGSDVFFSAGADATGTFNVSMTNANQSATSLTFEEGNITINGASSVINLTGTGGNVTVNSGASATIGGGNAITFGGTVGLTKLGAGTLTINSFSQQNFSGGVRVNQGTLVLDFAALPSPYQNLVNSANSLTLGGGTLSMVGRTGSPASSQTFAGTALNSGTSTITINHNTGTSSTLTLGTITRPEVGSVLNLVQTEVATFGTTNSGTQIIKVSNTPNTWLGTWAILNGNTTTAARFAFVDSTGQIRGQNGTSATGNFANVTSATTVYTANGTHNAAADRTALALQATNAAVYNLGANTLNVEGLLTIGNTINVTATTGRIRVGAGNELVLAGGNTFNISAPIADKTGSNSHVTFAGGGTLNLTGSSTYTGQTTVNSGTMAIGTNGSINSSSGIRINGGKLLQNNTATAISPTVSLVGGIAGGTIDGIGTINTVNVSDLVANKITNGNGTDTALTIGNLTFSGDATLDLRMSGGAQALTVSNTLTTTAANGKVVINVVAAPTWTTGSTYNLIGYGSWSGSISDFSKGTIPGLGARQNATLGTTGATNGFITLGITGDSALWTGAQNGNWTTTPVGGSYNWKTVTGNADTEFLTNDDVVFDDTATNTAVTISDANVATNTIIFNNITKDYTIAGTGIGISAGSLTKNGSGKVTLSSTNTYAGATTINGGTIEISGGSAISNTGLVTLANTAGATFRVLGSETIGALSGGGATGGSVVIDNGQILSLGSGTQTFGGVISGQGGLTVSGATQTLTGTNTYQGATLISSGTLEIGNGVTDGSIASTSGITTNGTLLLNLAADQNYSVGIDGTGGITKAGAGALTLSGINSYSGTTSITSGTVKAGSSTALGNNSAISMANTAGVTLDLNGNALTIGSLAGGGTTGGTVALGASNLTIKATTNNQTYNGLFTGSGKIIVDATTSTNLVNFGGTSTAQSTAFTGDVEVKSGTLVLGRTHNILGANSNGAGTQSITVSSGATARLNYGNAAYTQYQNFIISGTGADGNGALQSVGINFGDAAIGGLAIAANATVRVNRDSSNNNTNNLNVAGPLAGSGTLTLSGAGTTKAGFIRFSAASAAIGSHGVFSGNINLRDGITLTSNNGTALGDIGTLDIADGTSFALGASQSIGALADSTATANTGTVSLGANTLTIGNSTTNLNSSFAGVISGTSGSITKAGSGTLTLTNANTYTGTTTVNAGILKAGNATAFGPAANAKLAFGPSSTGTVQLNGNSMTVIALNSDATVGTPVLENASTNSAVLTVSNTTASTYAGVLRNGTGAGSLGLTKSGSSILTLSGDNDYSGTTAIGGTSGGIIVSANNALGNVTGNTTIASGTSLGFANGVNYSSTESIIGSGQGSTATGSFAATSRGFVQSVSGSNTFAGAIQINATGITRIGVQNGSQLTLTGPITMASGVSGVTMLFRGGLNNGDFITLASAGNSWDTDTQIFSDNAGTGAGLRLGIDNALPTNVSVKISGSGGSTGAMLDLASYNQTLNGLVANSLSLKISNSVVNTTSTLTLHTLADRNTSTGTVIQDGAGKVAVVKSGAFSQIIQTASTYTGGTWIKEGSIALQSGNDRLATSGSVVLGDTTTTGKLVLGESGAARNQTLAGLTATGLGGNVVGAHATNDSLLTLNITSGTNIFDGVLGGGGANDNNLALTKSGNGTLQLTNANTYNGDTTVTAGTLALTGTGSIANSANLKVNGTLDVSGITAGTFTVGAAQTLSGTGIINAGTKSLEITGTHAVGNSEGIQTITASNVTYAAGSIFEWELGANVGAGTWDHDSDNLTAEIDARGTAFDAVNITGDLDIDETPASGATFKIILGEDFDGAAAFWLANQTWNVFNVSGANTTQFKNFVMFEASDLNTEVNYTTYGSFTYTFASGTGSLNWTAVPEPTSALAGLLMGAGLLRRRRRD